jgi:hypothetical protein
MELMTTSRTGKLTNEQKKFLAAVAAEFSTNGELPSSITVSQISLLVGRGYKRPNWLMTRDNQMSKDRFMLAEALWQAADLQAPDTMSSPGKLDEDTVQPLTEFVPDRDPLYVPEGSYFKLVKLFKSKRWVPMWITGPTGVAKTMSIEQACAVAGREFFRIQITKESDEAALLGTFHLRNGETEFVQSRVITAMERGGVLLLDECDLASDKAMCLQPVLEGKSVYLTRANRTVTPAPGFQCVATANTKGRGDDTGMYFGTNMVNEAFLDRIAAMTIDHGYPLPANERTILKRIMQAAGIMDEQFIVQLVAWAGKCRENYDQGVISHTISPRRLCRIVEAYAVFEDKEDVVDMALARFNSVDRAAMKGYYTMFNGTTVPPDRSSNQSPTW